MKSERTEKVPKIIRLTTVGGSLLHLLKGQLNYINGIYEVIAVASGDDVQKVVEREEVRGKNIFMKREISLLSDFISFFKLCLFFGAEAPEIVHANTPKASLLSMLAAWTVGVPHRIYTVTGLRFETTTGMFRMLLKTMERLTCFFATKVIPEGEGVKTTLICERITRKPLEKILNGNINGIDMHFYARTPEIVAEADKIRAKVKCGTEGFIFGFVGRIVRDKGIVELVKAFARFYEKNEGARLILVGDFEKELDPLPPGIGKMIETHPGIFAMGYQSDVRPYYVAFDALVFPSYREGFPNVVLQAGAMELPSIVTNISGCNEIIIEGENGTIIPPRDEDALYRAMELFVAGKTTLLPLMAAKSRPLIGDRYEQSAVWQATLEMYNSLLTHN
jgi:glycosyltransferase involved in cell wall biosynthesis